MDQVDGDGGEEKREDLPHGGGEGLPQDPGDPVRHEKDPEDVEEEGGQDGGPEHPSFLGPLCQVLD